MKIDLRNALNRLAIFGVSAVAALLVYWLGYLFYVNEFKQLLHRESESALTEIQTLSDEVISTLALLNNQPLKGCDNEALTYLRKKLFLLKRVKEIGYSEGNLLKCTTGLGELTPPVVETAPDFIGPLKAAVWIDRPLSLFEDTLKGIVVRSGSYSAIFPREFIGNLIKIDTEWELVFFHNGQYKHVTGTEGVYRANLSRQLPFHTSLCSDKVPYCVAVAATHTFFYKQYHSSLVSCIGIAFLVFIISVILLTEFRDRYHSDSARIMRGFTNGAFFCLYQPIIELSSERVIGCEVLARFRDKDGDIYPDQFLPTIVRNKKTWAFTTLIIGRCLEEIKALNNNGEKFKININFFPQDIDSGEILEIIKSQTLKHVKFQFVVEIVESEQLMSKNSVHVLHELIGHGLQIAIDDFGTGYSNLRQLKKYHCHTLKIDRSFINEMEDGSIRSTLIPHILDIAKQVNANVVAEGIENTEQHKALVELGVAYGQGYMFGRPMSMEKLQAMLG
ncbi:EAL domain-containing protein [Shewanella avicenniae]|uniref:cyclic-guanylate-specific phosphodiesterase n=1 Tax=Shewanella avicenniae TaxID=2814294 RepID=A0ABX7QRZ9_9GAMM|nr:EAL domain-containing protein [Shewanella avicenniae]QSX33775.1 EAL domain-containing protein [Shewanella avicenniae]